MFLDLLDVMRAPGNVSEKPIEIAPRVVDDITFVAPLVGTIRAINARQNILISGAVHTQIEMECARCLKLFAQPLELDLEAVVPLRFVQSLLAGSAARDEESDEESELTEEELAVLFDGHSLDVLELIRQAAVLQAPRKPLCDEDCAGLPEAQNYVESGDSRWDALKNWKDLNGSA